MNPYLDRLIFKYKSIPRGLRYIGFGFFFMVLGVALSKYDPNVIFFIFAAVFALLGLVLFFMGVINGMVETIHFIRNKVTK